MEGLKPQHGPKDADRQARGEKTPHRFMLALTAFEKMVLGTVTVEGMERISSIPKDRKVIIATSHASDLDIQLATHALGGYFDLMITNQSLQHTFAKDPMSNIGMRVAGPKNFMPIEYRVANNKKNPHFKPEDYENMADAMDTGKTMVIAAHNPSKRGQLERGGYAAAYLAQLTNAVIVPVGVDIHNKGDADIGIAEKPLKVVLNRPDATVRIGEPFSLGSIEGIQRMAEIMDKRDRGERLNAEEVKEFSLLNKNLKEKSAEIMAHVAALIPEEKRGSIVAEQA